MAEQYTLRDLENLCGPHMKSRVNGTGIFGFPNRLNQNRFSYFCKSGEPYSSPNGHIASILFPNMQIPFEKLYQYPQITPSNRRVRVHCDCEAFQYWGPSFNSTSEGYRIPGTGSETRVPEIRDPMNVNLLCKHLIRVVHRVSHQTFPQLLRDFKIVNSHTSSLAPLVEPILRDYLERMGVNQNEILRICTDLRDHNCEQILEEVGILPVETDDV